MHDPAVRMLSVKVCMRLKSFRKASSVLDIPKSTLHRWVNANPLIQKQRNARKTTQNVVEKIETLLRHDPFITPAEIAKIVRTESGMKLSVSSVRSCVRSKCGFTRKKASRFVDSSKADDRRRQFGSESANLFDPERIVSIDESCLYFDMKPAYGRCLRSQRLRVPARPGGRARWSLIMAVTNQRVVGWKLVKGSFNSKLFSEFMSTLQTDQRDVVLLDNLSSHKTPEAMDTMIGRGLTPCFLPPYTPEFQPIEHCFSVVKNAFRRTPGALDFQNLMARDRGERRSKRNREALLELATADVARRVEQCLVHLTPEILTNQFRVCWGRAKTAA